MKLSAGQFIGKKIKCSQESKDLYIISQANLGINGLVFTIVNITDGVWKNEEYPIIITLDEFIKLNVFIEL